MIDARSACEFGAGHFPGSINIGLGSPSFSTWTGFMISGNKPIALVLGSESDAKKARLELARIGFDNLVGYITADALTENQTLPQISVRELEAGLKNDGPLVVDVRTPTEWKSGHIDGARHLPLSAFARRGARPAERSEDRSDLRQRLSEPRSPPAFFKHVVTKLSRTSLAA